MAFLVVIVVLLGGVAVLLAPRVRALASLGEATIEGLKSRATPTPRSVAKRATATPKRTQTPAKSPVVARPAAPFVNGLGMKFAPVKQPDSRTIFFSVWEARRRDYAAFAAAMPKVDPTWKTADWFGQPSGRGDDEPVVGVNWSEARGFCDWLTRIERAQGRIARDEVYRLPTDLEWSRAVGLGAETGATPEERSGKILGVYPWGAQMPPPPRAGNFGDETARLAHTRVNGLIPGGYQDGFATTAPVGSFAPGTFGLHDMAGNVWEWCEDFLWNPPKPDLHRVTRGGAFNEAGLKLLSSTRSGARPGARQGHVGFRVVLAAPLPR